MQGRVGVLLRGLVLSSLFYLVVMGSVVFVDELQAPFAATLKSPHHVIAGWTPEPYARNVSLSAMHRASFCVS
jgi:hypothetical protein